MTALTEAIQAGDAARVTSLLDENPALAFQPENNITPTLFALYYGKSEIAQLLAARIEPSFGEACALGDLARVQTLLGRDRALLDQRTADGFPPLGLAIFFRQPAIARYLIEEGADVSAAAENGQRVAPVHAAAAVCDRETMQLLLERGADVHATQQGDHTPLHGAASRGDIEMAKLLLANGASRDAKSADGMTPADVARKYGHADFADWIAGT